MDSFQSALEIVENALAGLHRNGVQMCASVGALARLASSRPPADQAPVRLREPSASVAAIPNTSRPKLLNLQPGATGTAIAPASSGFASGAASRLAPAHLPPEERLATMRAPVLACTKCPHLAASRTQVVFGVGNTNAELMFVGEAPGEEEDLRGEPFVGKAGQLLTKIIETMGYSRAEIYIANVLKCRPDMPAGMSGNRKPRPEEMQTCLPYLREQIEIIRPRVLVALGATAMEGLLGVTDAMARLRGRWHEFGGLPLMATYHPAYLLRNQALGEKRKVWEDMLLVLERLGRPISEKQRSYFLAKA